jgi:hypothetical protein
MSLSTGSRSLRRKCRRSSDRACQRNALLASARCTPEIS